jgi:N-acyl-D-amino-acid deacylase
MRAGSSSLRASSTSTITRVYGRGLLRPGQWADLAVFDAERVIDNATYENPHQYATGIEYVVVNSEVVLDQGRHTGARPGAIVPGPGGAPPLGTGGRFRYKRP